MFIAEPECKDKITGKTYKDGEVHKNGEFIIKCTIKKVPNGYQSSLGPVGCLTKEGKSVAPGSSLTEGKWVLMSKFTKHLSFAVIFRKLQGNCPCNYNCKEKSDGALGMSVETTH